MTRRRLRRAGWIGAIAYWLGGVCVAGCSLASPEVGHLRTELSAIRGDVAAVQATAARDVNEPVTGWILAIGYATVPASFLMYLIGHRFRWFRAAKDTIRGAKKKGIL